MSTHDLLLEKKQSTTMLRMSSHFASLCW